MSIFPKGFRLFEFPQPAAITRPLFIIVLTAEKRARAEGYKPGNCPWRAHADEGSREFHYAQMSALVLT